MGKFLKPFTNLYLRCKSIEVSSPSMYLFVIHVVIFTFDTFIVFFPPLNLYEMTPLRQIGLKLLTFPYTMSLFLFVLS